MDVSFVTQTQGVCLFSCINENTLLEMHLNNILVANDIILDSL